MELDLTQVRAFVVTAEQLHFGRAAARLFLTQQALSKRIQRLEHTLGEPLFVRATRGVALSDAGHRFLPHARALLAAADAAAQAGTAGSLAAAGRRLGPRAGPAADGPPPAQRNPRAADRAEHASQPGGRPAGAGARRDRRLLRPRPRPGPSLADRAGRPANPAGASS